MAATVYGSGVFGITAEDGLFCQSFDVDYSSTEVYLPDEDGDDVSGAVINAEASISMSGFRKTGETIDAGIGAAITLNNTPSYSEFGLGASGVALTVGGKEGFSNREFGGLDVNVKYKPELGALQV